ncbi:MAG TPA: cyclase family protein [candidate division Zixibacteria bacterium]|nr:cyclase family protein [candidate division Zixibacteria bacterium]
MISSGSTEWIDISVTIRDNMITWPGDSKVNIGREMEIARGDTANLTHLDMSAHTGTHMDAPLHFMENGKDISRMPLSAVIGEVRVLEINGVDVIGTEDLKRHEIKKDERILFKTKNSDLNWYDEPFNENFVHLSTEAAEYLANLKVQMVGIDYLSISGYKKNEARVHKAILQAGIWVIEGLNLTGINPGRYELVCLPLKILGGDGAPARAIIKPI